MDKLIDKFSSYNIFNYLFPGVVFCVVSDRYFSIPLLQESIINGLFLYYFVGLTISRFGSIAIEPLLKKLGVVKFSDYSDYIQASKSDPKIDALSESNNMYRTVLSALVALYVVIIGNWLVREYPNLGVYTKYALLLALAALFSLSYKKQTEYIAKRVSANNESPNR